MNKMNQRHVVIISAHPDDMEIGMGGTVAKLAEAMAVITSVVITNGGRSSNPFALTEQQMAKIRREEALRAAGAHAPDRALGRDLRSGPLGAFEACPKRSSPILPG